MRYLIVLCLFSFSIKPMDYTSPMKTTNKKDLAFLKNTVQNIKTSITKGKHLELLSNGMVLLSKKTTDETYYNFFQIIIKLNLDNELLLNLKLDEIQNNKLIFENLHKKAYNIIFDAKSDKIKDNFVALVKQTNLTHETKQSKTNLINSLCLAKAIIAKETKITEDINKLSNKLGALLDKKNKNELKNLMFEATNVSKNSKLVLIFLVNAINYISD